MPTFFDFYRQRTGDTKSDEDIALDFINNQPELVNRVPELRAKAEEIRRSADEMFPVTTGEKLKTAVGSGVRSFFGGIADIPEAIGVLNAEAARKGGELGLGEFPRAIAPLGAPEIMAPVGRAIRSVGEFLAPTQDPRLEESFLATKVPGYVGSAASFMATGAAGRLATGARAATGAALRAGAAALGEDALAALGEKAGEAALKAAPNSLKLTAWVAENAPIATAGALSQANGAYKEALSKSGGDRDVALEAGLLNLPIGATEIVPLSRMLHRLDGITGGRFSKTLFEAGKESFEEAAQEAGQQFAQNYVAQKLYDKDRNLLEDLQENAAGGGITGFLFSTVTQAIGHKLGGRSVPHFQEPPGASTGTTSGGLISLPPPQTAGQPTAPAAPAESPSAPVIARGMSELTGDIGPEDDLALRTLAKQDVAGALPATDPMRDIVARNPRLSNAYALYKEDAAKAAEIEAAAAQTNPNPTDAQIEAENYKKGHVNIPGVGEVSIETAKGETRRSKPGQPPWEVVMPNHYSQILGTKGADGDPLDLYIGDNPESPTVFVINQINPQTGKYDESKSMFGFASQDAAIAAYDASFSDGSGPTRRTSVVPLTRDQFQEWIKNGDHSKELKGGEINAQSTGTETQVGSESERLRREADERLRLRNSSQDRLDAINAEKRQVTLPEAAPTPTPLEGQPYEITPTSPPPAAPVAPRPVAPGVPAPVSATRQAVSPATRAAVDPFSLVDEQAPEHVNLEGKGINEIELLVTRNARVKEPMFDANGDRVLDSKGLPKQRNLPAATTTRMAFFEDTVTGKVFGVGTYENQQQSKGGVRVAYVGRAPGYKSGMPLRTFIEGGNTGPKGATKVPAGRYKPLDVIKISPVNATDKAHVLRFENRAEYEDRMLGPVRTLLERNASYEGNVGVVEAGEATGAPAAVTAVEQSTPATALEEAEGFTPDEAKAIYSATKDVRKGTAQDIYASIADDPDALFAAKKMLDIIGPLTDNDTQEAAQMLLEWIHDAHTLSKGKEKAFNDALTAAVSDARARNAGGSRAATVSANAGGLSGEAAQTEIPGVGAASPAGAAGTEPGAVGGSGQGEAAGAAGEADKVRHHAAPADLTATPELSDRYQSTLYAAAQQGLNVTVVQQGTAGIAEELSGVYGQEAGQRLAVVGVNDAAAPNIESLYVLTAEVAHDVFASLPAGEQARLQAAVRGVTDRALGITGENLSISLTAPEEERAAVLQEERLVDATTRSLVDQGFNPAEAKGVAQRLWRAIKDLLLRAARVLHDAWMGVTGQDSGEAGARIAQAYFENRVKSWLAGDARPLGFVDFMGGGKPSVQDRNRWFPTGMGSAPVTFRWNTETNDIEVVESLPDTIDAAVQNIEQPTMRFHRPGNLYDQPDAAPDTGVGAARSWIAAHNEQAAVITSLWNNFKASGNNVTTGGQALFTSEDAFATWILGGAKHLPASIVAAENEALSRTGKPTQNPDLRMSQLNADARAYVAAKTLELMRPVQTDWENRDNEARSSFDARQKRRDKMALRVVNLTNNYDDATFLYSELSTDLRGWLKFLREDVRKVKVLSRKNGVLADMIRNIEGRFDESLGTHYAQVIDRLAKKFGESEEGRTRFVVTLQRIAEMPVDFGHSDAQTIKDFITSNPDPVFNVLRDNSEDGRALLAVAASFAKSNALIMHMLTLRGAAKTDELMAERAVVNDALKGWISNSKSHIDAADRAVRSKAPRLLTRALAIKAELEEVKKDQQTLDAQMEDDKRFMALWEDSKELLRVNLAKYEDVVGAGDLAFEGAKGNVYHAPQSATAEPRYFQERDYNPRRDGSADAQLKQDKQHMIEWLAAHDSPHPLAGGRDYNRMSYELKKLEENEMQADQNKARRSIIQSLFGNVAVKLDDTGNPACKALARMYRDFQSWHFRYHNDAEVWTGKWALTQRDAMRALKIPDARLDNFGRRWRDPALNFIERRMRDLVPESANAQAALTTAIDDAMTFMGTPLAARTALRAHLQEQANVSFNLNSARAEMRVPIWDDALGLFRDTKSVKGQVFPKRLAGMFHRVYALMQGEAGAPRPWAGDSRLKPKDIAEEYRNDPANAKTMAAPYFAGDIWNLFVGEIANRSVRSAFKAPPDASGFARMATVEETKRAFDATAPGDAIAFAENLATITGVPASDMPSFIEETMDTFNQFFGLMHGIKQKQSSAAVVTLEPVSEMLMNSRISDELPSGWTEFRPMDLHNVRSILNTLTFHAAFGRGMEASAKLFHQAGEDFKAASDNIHAAQDAVVQRLPAGSTDTAKRSAVAEELRKRGLDLKDLEVQAKLGAMISSEQEKLAAFANSQGGVAMEFKPWSAIVSAAVTTLLQGPKTALTDTTSLFKPFQVYGFSVTAFKESLRAIKTTAVLNVGGFAELFGKTIKSESDAIHLARENGLYDSTMQATLNQRWIAAGYNMPETPGMSWLDLWKRRVWLGATRFRELTRTGLRIPGVSTEAEAKQFPGFNPIAPFTQLQRTMPIAASISGLRTFEDAVSRAAAWLSKNPTSLNDAAFTFTGDHADALGYTSKIGGLLDDKPAFVAMLDKLNGYGLSLETLAKDLIQRGGGSVLNDRAYTRLMIYGPTELLQDSSILTRQSSIYSNPALRANLPFIGWAMAQTGSLPRGFQSQFGAESDMKSLKRGITGLIGLVGVGLAYALLRDFYDEEALKKKSNRLTFKGADTPGKVVAATLDKLDAVGTFGIMGSLANSTLNVSTAREFTVDSRVFFVNSAQQFFRSAGVLYHQGGTATYATVGRQLAGIFGGAGAIEQLQLINAQLQRLGVDVENVPGIGAEARVTARINANNWLRVAGRELNLEVRTSRGASDAVPNKATPWVTEMSLAALGNDPAGFSDAYRNAITAFREEKAPDPVDSVKRAYESRNPLRAVFKSQLSEADVRRLLSSLPDDGRQDVMEAVRLFNRYGEKLSITPFWGRAATETRGASSGRGLRGQLPSVSDILRSQARLPAVAGF